MTYALPVSQVPDDGKEDGSVAGFVEEVVLSSNDSTQTPTRSLYKHHRNSLCIDTVNVCGEIWL